MFSTVTQTIPGAPDFPAPGVAVTFNGSTAISPDLSFIAPSTIGIQVAGIYRITWEVFPTPGLSAFALYFDPDGPGPAPPSLVPGSNYGSGAGNSPYTGNVLAPLSAGGELTLNRIDNVGAIQLQGAIGIGPQTISASLRIERIA